MLGKKVGAGVFAAVAALALSVPLSASAATQIGQTFTPGGASCSGGFTRLQGVYPGGQYAAPSDGVITAWSHQASSSPPQLGLKVAHPQGGTVYTVVGESTVKTPVADQLNTYSVRLPIRAGDVIGVYLATSGPCFAEQVGYTEHIASVDAPPGFMGTFNVDLPNNHQLDVSANLEPDCDSDAFGDETQDTDLSSCEIAPPDIAPPETTITKEPKQKTAKPKAKYEFASDEPGSTFECKIDKAGFGFGDCTSPVKLKRLDEGKHKFEVRAIDPAGNVDPSPAKDKFKVVD